MKTRNFKRKKTCPRCDLKMPESTEECPDCGFIFSRLKLATNKDAKTKMRHGERDFIVKTNMLPSDIKYTKLLLLTIFIGIFGGHYFYVGRYFRGSILLVNFLMVVLVAIFNAELFALNENLVGALCTIAGFIMLLWLWDIFMVAFKKFKVPVAIDLKNEDFIKEEEKL